MTEVVQVWDGGPGRVLPAGAIVSFVLGAVLLMTRVLLSLELGWWVQWLLVSVLWWSVFQHRRQLLGAIEARGGESRVRGLRLTSRGGECPRDWASHGLGQTEGLPRGARRGAQTPGRACHPSAGGRDGRGAGYAYPRSRPSGCPCAHGGRGRDADAAGVGASASGTAAGGARRRAGRWRLAPGCEPRCPRTTGRGRDCRGAAAARRLAARDARGRASGASQRAHAHRGAAPGARAGWTRRQRCPTWARRERGASGATTPRSPAWSATNAASTSSCPRAVSARPG